MRAIFKYFVLCSIFCAIIIPAAFSQAKVAKVALLDVDNINRDPRYDYLSGMISGILLYDLSRTEGISIIDRRSLDDVLKEQELMLGDMSAKDQIKIGKLLGANHLLRAGFVYLGDEVMVNLTLIDVETSKSIVLSRRGRTENTIHELAEDLVVHLTGQEVVFQSKETDRSIISLKDEKPGSIDIYCNLIRAEIILDGEFTGYSTGDSTKPFTINSVKPGKHLVKVVLSEFGVVKLPEITFHDWEQEVNVLPGKNHVLRATINTYSYQIANLIDIFRKTIEVTYEEGKSQTSGEYPLSVTDRTGTKIPVLIKLNASLKDETVTFNMVLTFNNREKTNWDFVWKKGEKLDHEFEAGIVKCNVRASGFSPNSARFDIRLKRTDIAYDEWKKKK
ncbi:MAG: hypothetical protein JW904_09030 [Spirochaetales bacterium]|nr:hypothetical protein [Spirochaetales bacterium]